MGKAYKESPSERAAYYLILAFLTIATIATLYPLIYVFSMSVSDVFNVARRNVWLLPKGFSLDAYDLIWKRPEIWRAYGNTIWYTSVGTSINLVFTMLLSYPLSRKQFVWRNGLMLFIAFTMWFRGGMLPTFILVNSVGLYNTRWAMVIPNAIIVWNVIITRTFLQANIHDSLVESAKVEGANDFYILLKIVVPLAKAIVAVNVLFYAVMHWNSFFNAILYLPEPDKQPIQIFLRNILIQNQGTIESILEDNIERALIGEKLKYAVIIFTMLPIMAVYPFLQKYFVKGVMIGAVKA